MGKEKNEISFYHQCNIEIIKGKSVHNFPKHSHSAFCIGIVTSGCVRFFIKGQEHLLEKNNVYYIPPFTEHKIASANKIQYGYIVVCLHSGFIKQYSNILLNNYVCKDNRVGIKILDIYEKYYSANDCYLLEYEIEQFLWEHIEIAYGPSKQMCNTTVMSVASFIKDHLDQPFDLKKISDYTNLSKYHLLRLFKNQMGVAPYQFYLQEKVNKIKQGLLKEQLPVDLAYYLNFSDQSHLCNTFKKHVGLTPIQFIRSYNGNTD